jgi:hypothetical protein
VVKLLLNDPHIDAKSKDIKRQTLVAIQEKRNQVIRLLMIKTSGNPVSEAAPHNDQSLAWTAADGDCASVSAILAMDATKVKALHLPFSFLRGQARKAREFVLKYEQRYGGNQGELQGIVDRFESTIRDKIIQLE